MPPVRMHGDGRKAKNPGKTLLRLLSYLKKYWYVLAAVRVCIIVNSIAQTTGVPAYVVFSNATLSAMAARRPENTRELMAIPGVGEVKARRYGKQFLRAIQTFTED